MPELPLELCQAVVDEVDSQSDLLPLLLVSFKFNSAAERRLYRTVILPGCRRDEVSKRKWDVFGRICTCPRVASYVFHLKISRTPPLPHANRLLAKVFMSVPNLKSLHVFLSPDIARNLLQSHVPFLLRTFSCSGCIMTGISLLPRLEPFLEAQVELEELLLRSNYNPTLTPSALPNLKTVRGSGDMIRAILPGRPVTRVHRVYRGLASAFDAGPLRSLCLEGSSKDLQFYTTSLPTLTFLELEAWDYEDAFLTPYLGSLSSLEKLRIIIDGGTFQKKLHDEQLAFVRPTFAGCPSLCYIEFYDNDGDSPKENDKSTTWGRNSQTGTPSCWDLDEWRNI